jgi:hypothetical protein
VTPVVTSITSISTRTLLEPETLTLCFMVRTGAIFAELQTETELQETVFDLRAFTVSLPLKGVYPRPLPQPVNKDPSDPMVTTRPMVSVRRQNQSLNSKLLNLKPCQSASPHRNSDMVGLEGG